MATQLNISRKKELLFNIAKCFDSNAQLGFISKLTSSHHQRFELAIKPQFDRARRLFSGGRFITENMSINIDDELMSCNPTILVRDGCFISWDDAIGPLFKLDENTLVRKSFDIIKKNSKFSDAYCLRVERKNEHIYSKTDEEFENICLKAATFEEFLIAIDLQQTVSIDWNQLTTLQIFDIIVLSINKGERYMNKTPYSFEFPVPFTHPRLPIPAAGVKCTGIDYATIEECVAACKAACAEWGVNYDDRDVKLFMTDTDGKWEVTEEGELAG